MSNGVEVIVAGDKSTLPGEPNILRILPSSHYKPMSLTPSTLKGDHMLMMLPLESEIDDLFAPLNQPNQFFTKTCLTTYTYLTTYLQDGTTTVESREKVISNTATEERNSLKITPTPTAGITLSQTPKLAIGVFHTTYTYLNTIFEEHQPMVMTSKHTVTNTITAPDDYLSLLQPSEPATAIHDTNTYYSTIELAKTLYDDNSDGTHVISTTDVLTQVVITESLPSRMASVMTSYIAFDVDDSISNDLSELATTDVVKTYFVTYTYFNTFLENGSTIVRSNVSTSSDLVTEKLYLFSKKTVAPSLPPIHQSTDIYEYPSKPIDSTIQIYATKTYLTTFTYFTTLLQDSQETTDTIVNSHTRVVENVITESIPNRLFPHNSIADLKNSLKHPKHSNGLVTVATLIDGQALEITALDSIKSTATLTTDILTFTDTNKILFNENNDESINSIYDNDANITDADFLLPSALHLNIARPTHENHAEIVSATEQTSVNGNGSNHSNTTKYEKIDNYQVSDLIGSFNFNRLNAFGPVFNAMAGLIQNNFANKRSSPNSSTTERPNDTEFLRPPNVSAVDVQGRNPMYIPVGGIAEEGIESAESQNIEQSNFNSFVPPPGKWINEEVHRHKIKNVIGKTTYESSLLNGGIPISPGEVITANSDVIIGRPTGIGPRIPLNQKKLNEIPIGMQPPPPDLQSSNHIKQHQLIDSVAIPSIHSETYIGPPPLQAVRHPQNVPNKITHYRPNVIPIIYNNDERNLHSSQSSKSSINQSSQHSFKEEIIEIQRIPEVYSTDLPPIHVLNYPIEPSRHHHHHLLQNNHASNTIQLPDVIERSTIQPLLVNIQPSQIANVIIPHGSTTALIYGGTNEPHKNGQYFDEPSPYPDADVSVGFSSDLNQSNDIYISHTNDKQIQFGHVNIKPHKPILSNQEVNLDANVLSQDVNLHVPPITFTYNQQQHVDGSVGHLSPNADAINNLNPTNFDFPVQFTNGQHGNADISGEKLLINQNLLNSNLLHHYNQPNLELQAPVENQQLPNIGARPIIHTDHNSEQSHIVISPSQHSNYRPEHLLLPKTNNPTSGNVQLMHIHNKQPTTYGINNGYHNNKIYQQNQNPFIDYYHEKLYGTRLSSIHKGYQQPPLRTQIIPFKDGPSYVQQSSASSGTRHSIKRPNQVIFYIQQVPNPHLNTDLLPPMPQPQPLPSPPTEQYGGVISDQSQHQQQPLETVIDYMIPPPTQLPPKQYPPNRVHPVYIDNSGIDVSPVEHSQAPSIDDGHVDEHLEDDLENDEGEVIQESNSVPLVPGQLPGKLPIHIINTADDAFKDIKNISSSKVTVVPITSIPKPKSKPVTSKPTIPEFINTQTEANKIWNMSHQSINNSTYFNINNHQLEKPYRPIPSSPLASLINELRPIRYQPQPRPPLHPRRPIPLQSPTDRNPLLVPPPLILALEPPVLTKQHQHSKSPINPLISGYKRLQTSMSINSIGLDNTPNNGQTEKPFDPKFKLSLNPYLQSINVTTMKPGIISTTIIPKIITTTTPRTTKEVLTTAKSHLNDLTLNTGEITTKKFNDSDISVTGDYDKDISEIFDFKESINPHNYGVIKETKRPLLLHDTNAYDVYDQKPYDNTDDIPEPSIDMKPPPVKKYHSQSHSITEMVMGLNPPPIQIDLNETSQHTSIAQTTILQPTDDDEYHSLTSNQHYRTTIKPYWYQTVNRSRGSSATTTDKIYSLNTDLETTTIGRQRTRPPYKQITRTTRKPQPITINSIEESYTNHSEKMPLNHKKNADVMLNINPTPSVAGTKDELPLTYFETIKTDTSRHEGHIQQYSRFNNQHSLSGDILILGSEHPISEDPTRIIITTPISTTTAHYVITSMPSINHSVSSRTNQLVNQVSITLPATKLSNTNTISKPRSRTKSPIDRSTVILPTKYITNTKTLTVTTTKTTVIRSQGITTTLTLTLTKTSTIIDTVTHKVTHTLVKPTRVTIEPTVEIRPTSTVYSVPAYPNYPAFPVQVSTNIDSIITNRSSTFIDDDEIHLDEFLINYDATNNIVKLNNKQSTVINNTDDNNSIFVVMTDQTQPGTIKINSSMIDTITNINAMNSDDSFDLVNRDEDDMTKEVNHVLLGGILIASPPRLDSPKLFTLNECRPDCKASRNELCQRADGQMRCVCRPGFARMFPDRPCKPTYTYTLQLPLDRHGTKKLHYEEAFAETTSPKYAHLVEISHDGLDRMVMQSDLRDVYQGVHIIGFSNTTQDDGVNSDFYLQLSDSISEMRLIDVFKKYLRNNNYSLGGTELYSSRSLIDDMGATDFDECLNAKFHDCSENSHCFNLRGTYTCSCKDGYADLSENPIYPGRVCSAELIGCEKCHYHGTCYFRRDEKMLCECFQWYAGANCHINLKVLLIALITLGTILFALLLACLILTCMKRKRRNSNSSRALVPDVSIIPSHKTITGRRQSQSSKIDKRAMIQDTSSEISEDSSTLPYVVKNNKKLQTTSSSHLSNIGKFNKSTDVNTMEQKDRSLTVMIPRAKYHPLMINNTSRYNIESYDRHAVASVCSTTEAKLLSYLDASPSSTKDNPQKKSVSSIYNKHNGLHATATGALVSAGFEVSATVGTDNDHSENLQIQNKLKAEQQHPISHTENLSKSNDPLNDWLDTVPQNELTVSEARSYDETTIQLPTKTLQSIYDKQSSHMNNDEANTMAERDLGSTFLLPHTHLYKPDRSSDISGFDSL